MKFLRFGSEDSLDDDIDRKTKDIKDLGDFIQDLCIDLSKYNFKITKELKRK